MRRGKARKFAADEKVSTLWPSESMSLLMELRKYRLSSTTETNDVFGIGFRQFARTAMQAAPNNVVCPHANSTTTPRYRRCNASGP